MADKLRAVLVGCGGITRAWLRGIEGKDDVEIVGMVDLVVDTARERAEQFGLTPEYIGADMHAALDALEPDMVFNCTTPKAHAEVTLGALAHGCHVLSEKPLADSMENAKQMVEASENAGKLFAVIQNRRYHAGIRRLRRFLRDGTIGQITTLDSDFYIGAHFGGFRDRMEHVLLLDMAIHTFDAARLIAAADPVSVYCKEWNPAGSWYDHDASAVAVFELQAARSQQPIVYTYRGSWCAEGMNTSWECDWRVIGQQGTVTWDGAEGFAAEVISDTGGFRSEYRTAAMPPLDPADRIGAHAGQIADFCDCVRTGRVPETTGSDNIKSLAMVFGAIESAGLGREIACGW